jgi:hypothetical protein
MKPEQMRKFVGWCGFYVALPVLIYPAAALIGTVLGNPISFQEVLIKGDLLFIVVVLLATTVDWTIIDFRLTSEKEITNKWADYLIFVGLILALIFYTMVYGVLLTTRLPGGPPVAAPGFLAGFTAVSFITGTIICGAQYFNLLRQGRI